MPQPIKILIFAASFTIGSALAVPASAEPKKDIKQKKEAVTSKPDRVNAGYRGQDKFRAGPLYDDKLYLGDDPDPFIRLQIYRDLGAKHGGTD